MEQDKSIEALLTLLKVAIENCQNKNKEKAKTLIAQLIGTVDFETGGEIASKHYKLYEYCFKSVNLDQFDTAKNILQNLYDIWEKNI